VDPDVSQTIIMAKVPLVQLSAKKKSIHTNPDRCTHTHTTHTHTHTHHIYMYIYIYIYIQTLGIYIYIYKFRLYKFSKVNALVCLPHKSISNTLATH